MDSSISKSAWSVPPVRVKVDESPTSGSVTAIVATVASTTTSVIAASNAAQAQEDSNQRAAEQAAKQASMRNAAQNQAAQEQATAEMRQRFSLEKERAQAQASNQAQFAGMEGGFLGDVSNAVELSAADEKSALTVQGLFYDENAQIQGATTQLQMDNRIGNLPTGGSTGLTIASSLVDGLSTGVNVGGAVLSSGVFQDKKPLKVDVGGDKP